MSNAFVSVELDQGSMRTTITALRKFGKDAERAIKDVVDRTALAIETDAKEKLKADGHIVTGRLRGSIHAELKNSASYTYKDDHGKTFDGALKQQMTKLEAVAGTNVSYAPKIEFNYDSFLRWAAEKQKPLFVKRMQEALNRLIK